MHTIQRVFHGKPAPSLTDISGTVNDYRSAGYSPGYHAGEYLYVGSEVPFCALWLDLLGVNASAATPAVQIRFGQAWSNAVDIIDNTAVSGAALARSGLLTWSTDLNKGWDPVQYSFQIPELLGTNIYYFYWARLSWSADLDAATKLKYVGQKFSTDTDLTAYYPDLANAQLMTMFKAGKTDWTEQAFMAAEQIVRELIGKKVIISRGQIIDWSRLVEPSVHKVAELIYRGLGTAFEPRREAAHRDYAAAMNRDFFRVDFNGDGKLEPADKVRSCTFMRR